MAVLGEGRVVGYVAVEAQPTEPAIGQIEVNLVTKPPLGPDAVAVAHQQHTDHQLRIDRGPTHLAVVRLKVSPNARQIDEPIDLAQHVIARHVPFQAEAIKQRLLHHCPFAHHRPNLLSPGESELGRSPSLKEFFNTISCFRTLENSAIDRQTFSILTPQTRCVAFGKGSKSASHDRITSPSQAAPVEPNA